MSLESVFRLSLIMNMIDNLTGPMAGVTSSVNGTVSKLQKANAALGNMAKTGAVMQEVGSQITGAVLSPVEATFETRRAIGELASLGVKDLGVVEDAARQFSDQWAGTTKADFIAAAYDIKSGIATLSDEGVAEFTSLAGLTAKATKSTVGEMTSLFATGYGIYKNYYDDMSDIEFGEMFSAGIAKSVQQFKTTGSEMASSIESLGASATNANVPLEEQLTILGKVEACNNAFDDSPAWEDITAQVAINRVYNFLNESKTAEKWGVNVRFTITKNEGYEEEVSISGFGGAYE